jgi:D-arabinose 1-dehydrogenase-like Zn-dependent alcohol dehydrogenase
VTAIARQADKAKEAKALGAAEFVVLEEALEKRKNAFDIVLNTACGQVDNAKVRRGRLEPGGGGRI